MKFLRKDRSVLRGTIWIMVLFGVPFVGGVLAFLFGYIPEQMVWWGIAAIALIWIIGFALQWVLFHRMMCPTCEIELRRQTASPGDHVVFTCNQCGTTWDTGFIESTGE